MSGSEVKAMILESGLKLRQIADKLGMNDGNFSRRLRKNFSEAEVEKVKNAIQECKKTNRSCTKVCN